MKYLIDTHVFLGWISNDESLTETIIELISDKNNEIYFSAASCWEIVIKARLGKLTLPEKPDNFILKQLSENSFISLPIQLSHALNIYNLPDLHKDPFDRMIVSQAQLDKLAVISNDVITQKYDVDVVW